MDKEFFSTLRHRARSPSASALIERICDDAKGRKSELRIGPRRKTAMGAILADLLRAEDRAAGARCYRPCSAGAFTGGAVGYRPFKWSLDTLKKLGLVEVNPGYCSPFTMTGTTTRFRGTAKLWSLASDRSILPSNWSSHFVPVPRPASVSQPVTLKAHSSWVRGKRIEGRPLAVDHSHPKVIEAERQVRAINDYFSRQVISPDNHEGFRRQFNEGDAVEFNWNKGGRLYSIGGGYQMMPSKERMELTINGEATIELDLQASHLTILHALTGTPLPKRGDPYRIKGVPRAVVKYWVNMTLGHDRFHRRWTEASLNKNGKIYKLNIDFPIKEIKPMILRHIKALVNWETCAIRWSDLQYEESCIIIATVIELATHHDTPALPVHDSIIVPISKEEIAKEILQREFRNRLGINVCIGSKR